MFVKELIYGSLQILPFSLIFNYAAFLIYLLSNNHGMSSGQYSRRAWAISLTAPGFIALLCWTLGVTSADVLKEFSPTKVLGDWWKTHTPQAVFYLQHQSKSKPLIETTEI